MSRAWCESHHPREAGYGINSSFFHSASLFRSSHFLSTLSIPAFLCDQVGDVAYLKADYEVVCTSAKHTMIKLWASLAILTYPVGISLTYACLLFRVRHKVLNGEHDTLSSALSFLHRPFKPAFAGWEMVNVAQKLFLVGFVLIQPGSFISSSWA